MHAFGGGESSPPTHGLTMDYPRRELLDHVAARGNLTLLAPRGIGTQEWRHAFITDKPANDCVISNLSREANQVFPLWRFGTGDVRQENLSPNFRNFLDARYDHHYNPRRNTWLHLRRTTRSAHLTRYTEFLRIDFPRVPFPKSADDFERLSKLGWALVQAHLLREVPRTRLAAYQGKGDHTNHVSEIADSLAFTIEQTAKIDKAVRRNFWCRGEWSRDPYASPSVENAAGKRSDIVFRVFIRCPSLRPPVVRSHGWETLRN